MASRRSLIRDALVAQLQTITTAGGYQTDPVVQKAKLPRNDFRNLPLVVVATASESKVDQTNIDVVKQLVVTIECFPFQEAGSEIDEAVDLLVTDVQKALLLASEADPQLGVAGVTDLGENGFDAYELDMLGLIGATVPVTLRYRHDVDDPATYRGSAT